jgi:hypothetical protein
VFPVNGSLAWHRPSLPWVPASPVPHLRRYYDGATTSRPRILGRLYVRFQGPHAPPSSCSHEALPRQRRTAIGPGTIGQPASLFPANCTWARAGSLRFPGDPSCIFALFLQTPAEPTRPRHYRPCRCCPRSQHSEGFSTIMISGLPQGFDACCLRFTSGVAATHARLASGWRAAPLPGGGRTLWIASKGFDLHVFLLSRIYPDAS